MHMQLELVLYFVSLAAHGPELLIPFKHNKVLNCTLFVSSESPNEQRRQDFVPRNYDNDDVSDYITTSPLCQCG